MVGTEDGAPAQEKGAKMALRQLVKDTVKMGQTAGLSLGELQGIAFNNMKKDEKIKHLHSFPIAVSKIVCLPRFVESFGAEAAQRIVLQCVYQYFKRGHVMSYNEEVFESTYGDLIKELESPV
jgi:hypothetical protein